jgi:pimeloyl-ACP methyl ester carboxylesterase
MLDNPHRVSRLLMISSATIATAMGLVWRLDQLAGLKALEAYDGTPEAMRRFLEIIVNDHSRITDEMIQERVRNAALPGHDYVMKSQREYRNRLREDPELQQLFDIRHRLPKIAKPMHVVWGAKDNFAPPQFADELRGVLPNVTFEIFENSGHQSQSDEPARFNERALQFFTA